MKNLKALGFVAMTLCLLASCKSYKKVPYIVGAETIPAELLAVPAPPADPVIQPGDLLNIQITGTNAEAVAPFNKGSYIDSEGRAVVTRAQATSMGENSSSSTDYYLVDREGNISFPIVGTLHVAGLTKSQVSDLVIDAIYPKYLKEKPVVDIRFMNFRVTMLGAVKSPGVKVSQNERLNLFEAIGLAGDLDIYGDRENIMLVRTNPDGSREIHKLNIHDKDILLSPYYNLQPNDMVIVNYNRSGAQRNWTMDSGFTTTLQIIGGVSSVLGLVMSVYAITKLK